MSADQLWLALINLTCLQLDHARWVLEICTRTVNILGLSKLIKVNRSLSKLIKTFNLVRILELCQPINFD